MAFRQVFDIIGPIMIGPSSSHTAGAVRIGRVARQLFGRRPVQATITLYGSFAQTYRGHGTDVALIGGLLDFETFDDRIRNSFDHAKEEGIQFQIIPSISEPSKHPNTAKIQLTDGHKTLEVVGVSIGGGAIEVISIDHFGVSLSASSPTLVILHHDRKGVIANVTAKLAAAGYNIGHMEVSRRSRGADALMIIETDESIHPTTILGLQSLPDIVKVSYVAV
jgi:L-serine dehydratase